jgi:hypothetical protein
LATDEQKDETEDSEQTQKRNPKMKPKNETSETPDQNQTDDSSRGKPFDISRSPNISVPDRPK